MSNLAQPAQSVEPSQTGPATATSPAAPPTQTDEFYRIGDRFRVVARLGQGGSGDVLHVHDELLNEHFALKLLSPEHSGQSVARERFLREAASLRRLLHPRVVRTFDAGEHEGRPYLVMELMSRGSIHDRLKQCGVLPPLEATAALEQALEALTYVHQQGIVHRDVKPHNLLVSEDGSIKLGDFGIAQASSDEFTLTQANDTMGTRGYMAPEQEADPRQVGPRADIYAAGATLWAMITGRPPGQLAFADNRRAQLHAVPVALRGVIRRATSFHSEARYRSAEEMALKLRRASRLLKWEMSFRRRLGGPVGLIRSVLLASLLTLGLVAVLLAPGDKELPLPVVPFPEPPGQAEVLPTETSASDESPGSSLKPAPVVSAGPRGDPAPVPLRVPLPEQEGSSIQRSMPPEPPPPPRSGPNTLNSGLQATSGVGTAVTLTTVFVNSQPWSDVYLNGRLLGRTRQTQSLQPGQYSVLLLERGVAGGKEKAITLTIAEGSPDRRICWDFEVDSVCDGRDAGVEDPPPVQEAEQP